MTKDQIKEALETLKNICKDRNKCSDCEMKKFCNEFVFNTPSLWDIGKIMEAIPNEK